MSAVLHRRLCARTLLVAVIPFLVSCGVSSTEELTDWMAQERSKKRAAVPPTRGPREFQADAYLVDGRLEPFSSQRLAHDQAVTAPKINLSAQASRFELEWSGERQPLEKFPLDSVQFRGTMRQESMQVALVWADSRLHQVRTGDYLGTRRGKVLQITPTEMRVRELVKDESGRWSEKTVTLSVKQGDS